MGEREDRGVDTNRRKRHANQGTNEANQTETKTNMGRVRTKTVKRASRTIIEKYYSRMTLDFDINKRLCDDVAIIQSKRLRNKIAGFATHLMKRIQRGPVRGISLKLQEEERERRLDYVPDVSAINTEKIEVDRDTMAMLKSLNMGQLPGVQLQQSGGGSGGFRGRKN